MSAVIGIMGPRRCKVKGCKFEDARLREFPGSLKDKERCLKWIAACCNPEVTLEKIKNAKICDAHFEKRYKLSTHLSRTAVPTLYLPEPLDIQCSVQEEIEVMETIEIVTTETHIDTHGHRSDREDTTEITQKTAEVMEETAEVTEETAEVMEETAEVTEETADVKEETTEVTEEIADVTEEIAEVTEETAEVTEKIAEVIEETVVPITAEELMEREKELALQRFCTTRREDLPGEMKQKLSYSAIYELRRQNRPPSKCKVKGCEFEDRRMREFPSATKDRERRLKWIAACGDPDLITSIPKSAKICDLHFEDRYKLSTHLSRTAVPTLYLPESINVQCLAQHSVTTEKHTAKLS
ncbi:uncharacterized protein LOC128872313 isoform X1 [Hylaeus volcanicus]|uniref:uncharacterized protein LOC128872313 isoform X1 n=2 Tax=Hylaeus volcanicus TaxID=313075 RepID=UPI0023B8842E|nr:uncharacterized protein LOC128872313 isoform X1 [Hylaeus volcanicus]